MHLFRISFLLLVIYSLTSCHSNPKTTVKPKETYKEEVTKLNDRLNERIGTWAQEGSKCFGLIVLANKDQSVKYGKSIQAVIVSIRNDSLKMKALETINLAKTKDCNKLGISTGSTWWEKEGELFLTREEADNYLKTKGWVYKDDTKGRFKVGN